MVGDPCIGQHSGHAYPCTNAKGLFITDADKHLSPSLPFPFSHLFQIISYSSPPNTHTHAHTHTHTHAHTRTHAHTHTHTCTHTHTHSALPVLLPLSQTAHPQPAGLLSPGRCLPLHARLLLLPPLLPHPLLLSPGLRQGSGGNSCQVSPFAGPRAGPNQGGRVGGVREVRGRRGRRNDGGESKGK